MKFEVTVLGCGSATPTLRHNPTSQLVKHNSTYLLLDCGEGTQLQLRRYGIKFQQINHIFITHLHGDHCLGLPGLISTMHLLGRTKELHVYANSELQEATEVQFKISHSYLRFAIHWHPLEYTEKTMIWENRYLKVESFPLRHRVPCCGFIVSEKARLRNIKPEMIKKYSIPIPRIRQIKAGAALTLGDGKVISNEELTVQPSPKKSYAFCTDSAFLESTAEYVAGSDLLYHESTFLESEKHRAVKTYHSTAREAARVAALGQVKQLMLGHYSARYRQVELFLEEAQTVFPNTILGMEGLTVTL